MKGHGVTAASASLKGTSGKVHDITPEGAGWTYVGFGLYRLAGGEAVATKPPLANGEVILVMVEGKAAISAGGIDYGT
jgi:5-deoxy-glucuronate isomerase